MGILWEALIRARYRRSSLRCGAHYGVGSVAELSLAPPLSSFVGVLGQHHHHSVADRMKGLVVARRIYYACCNSTLGSTIILRSRSHHGRRRELILLATPMVPKPRRLRLSVPHPLVFFFSRESLRAGAPCLATIGGRVHD